MSAEQPLKWASTSACKPGTSRRGARLLLAGIALLAGVMAALPVRGEFKSPRYVFLLIGDGMGELHAEAAERAWAAAPENRLVFRTFPVRGEQRTGAANNAVTDSAAAATAMACGVRTLNGRIAMTTNEQKLTSIAHLVHQQGRKVGILTNIGIDHATPAAFYAQAGHRNSYADIAAQMAGCPFEFMGGSAMIGLKPAEAQAIDNEALAVASGFVLVNTRQALRDLPPGRRIFAHQRRHPGDRHALPWAISATTNDIPLAEFAAAAIRHLQGSSFFIMIEGGQIDSAAHANDLASVVREVGNFNDVARVCLDFARAHPDETLIVVTGDHETGGLMRLNDDSADPGRLLGQTLAGGEIVKRFQERLAQKASFTAATEELVRCFGSGAFTAGQLRQIEPLWQAAITGSGEIDKRALAFVVQTGKLFVEGAGYGFTTGGHTGVDIPVYAHGVGAAGFAGRYDNTAIFDRLKELMIPPGGIPANDQIRN